MDLKALLLKDFGKDLPIAGGFGQSAFEPILLTTADPQTAMKTQLEVAKCIYAGSGFYWRLTGGGPADVENERIEKLSFEVKYIEGDDVITEKRNLYFDLREVERSEAHFLDMTGIAIELERTVIMPWKMGWFSYSDMRDYEVESPGSGISLAYSAPSATMTVYLYSNGDTEGIKNSPDEFAHREFVSVISHFESVYTESQLMQFVDEDGVRVRVYELGDAISAVMIMPLDGLLLKLRLTLHEREAFMLDCAWDSIWQLVAFVKQSIATAQ